jgi:hypothetical protein
LINQSCQEIGDDERLFVAKSKECADQVMWKFSFKTDYLSLPDFDYLTQTNRQILRTLEIAGIVTYPTLL